MASHPERIAAIVLAAGESTRLAPQKLLLPFGNSSVIGSVVRAIESAGLRPVVVVAGAQTLDIAETLTGTRATVIPNPDPKRGMLSSLRVGIEALPEDVDGFIIALGDQPRLRPDHIDRLLSEQRQHGRGIAIASHRGKKGHPVAFGASYRAKIMALSDSQTLRDLIHGHQDDVIVVECGSDAVIRDIDTREDYESELRRLRH